MTRTPQMVRLSCKAQRDGRPCGYTLTIELGLEDWAKDVMRKHVSKKHAGFMEIKHKELIPKPANLDLLGSIEQMIEGEKPHDEKETNGATTATEEADAEAASAGQEGKAP
jgi:hypothetical protein